MIVAVIVVGVILIAAGWRLVATGRVSIWIAQAAVLALVGLAALATGRVRWSPRAPAAAAAGEGLAAGLLLYLATVAFVLIVRRWPVFERHVAAIYGRRGDVAVPLAVVLAALVTAPGEELFWRGLAQPWAGARLGWTAGTGLVYVVYVLANLCGANLPIAAGAVVAGGAWTALAWWTHGVLASILCHGAWTALMVALPPGGTRAVERAV